VLPKQEGRVDQLDVDPAALHSLDAVGDLNELAGGLLGIGPGVVSGKFHDGSLSRSARANALACSSACSRVRISGRNRRLGASSQWKNFDSRPSVNLTSKEPSLARPRA
jgi:hypothetical protein